MHRIYVLVDRDGQLEMNQNGDILTLFNRGHALVQAKSRKAIIQELKVGSESDKGIVAWALVDKDRDALLRIDREDGHYLELSREEIRFAWRRQTEVTMDQAKQVRLIKK